MHLSLPKFVTGATLVLFVSAAYLYSFPAPTVLYACAVLVHAGLGLITAACLLRFCWRCLKDSSLMAKIGWVLLTSGAFLGVVLIYLGTTRPMFKWLYAHIALCLLGLVLLGADLVASTLVRKARLRPAVVRVLAVLLLAALAGGLAGSAKALREGRWLSSHVIKNPDIAPETMNSEGDGPGGLFFPSSAQVVRGGHIPSKFFMESDSCKRCHADIYNEWYSSVHHFSSFNNQWYRKSIEYMQEVVGTKPSKWCGGCHDPAVLYSGLMDTPIKQIVHRPESQAGLGCMMCHSIVQVKSTMGQGDFYLEYPKLHELAASKNPVVRAVHDFLTYLNPEPHRRTFLKPFMRTQTAEFCSSCHKVHLDVPVNHYRWFRGFDEYDNWQASGISGFGARSFYYPVKSQQCADCHMPLQKSADAGGIEGFIHSHRFPAANTALPVANEDAEQLKVTEDFLKNKILSVDIFALSPAQPQARGAALPQSELSTTFAVGEEAETETVDLSGGKVAPLTAPLNRVQPAVRRGDTVRVDVVVRTRTIGHFFPGGTVDAFDAWLELKATDDRGKTIFWSGRVDDDGKGPVEKGAHFYRSLQVDGHGHRINKRNAWSTRAVVYARLIPPGAADTVHFRIAIPRDAGDRIRLHARLCYRKFSWYNTQFSFAGVPDAQQPNADVSPAYDDRQMVFSGSTGDVSAKEKKIPDLPIVALAEDEVTLQVIDSHAPSPLPQVELNGKDWQRWNDYGIGLFLQGDLKGAEAAFQKITEIDPQNPDGWVNVGRAAIQEGDTEHARTALKQALAINPTLARTNFFYAKVLRNDGDYDGAIQRLRIVLSQYPRDRVALNDLGRILFLQRKYAEAIQQFRAVLEIDPEDVTSNYNLMLCYNGSGDQKLAHEFQVRYLRFKADEASQALTGPYRLVNPEDNRERQAIHEHLSAPLDTVSTRSHQKQKAVEGAKPPGKKRSSDMVLQMEQRSSRLLTDLSASELAQAIRARQLSPTEVVEGYLRRIEDLNPKINAFVGVENEAAIAQAKQAEAALIADAPAKPLLGVPITIKASIDVRGMRCEAGTRLREGYIAARDAPLVARLKHAGAIVIGNTTTPEMLVAYHTENLLQGRTNNPHKVARTPGGSSGGEAAAISCGMSAAGIGSDAGGSVRVPAHFCGICSLKPTPGRIPATGHFPPVGGPFSLIGVVGPMARTVEDLQLLLEITSGYDAGDPVSIPSPRFAQDRSSNNELRIGFYEDDGFSPPTPETRIAVRAAAHVLEERGFVVEPFRPDGLDHARELWFVLFVEAIAMVLRPMVQNRDNDTTDNTKEFLALAAQQPPLSGERLLNTLLERDNLRTRFLEQMEQFPILLAPVCSIPAFLHEDGGWGSRHPANYVQTMSYCQHYNLLGNPAAVVPVGQSPDGLPIGVQIVGRPYKEDEVLAVARIIDEQFGWKRPPMR